MEKISLQDGFTLKVLGENVYHIPEEEIEAKVPGTVYGTLLDKGLMPDPYFGDNELTATKLMENDFEYRPRQTMQRIYCASIYELVDLVDAFGDPEHVGVCYDFGHANLGGHDFHRQNLNIIGSRLHAIHVQDNHGVADEHLMPFHGNIDWAEAMAGLADIGYDGDLTYEIQEFGRYLPNDQKHLVVEYSIKIGKVLMDLYEKAKAAK